MNKTTSSRKPRVTEVSENLRLIALYPPIRGFEDFIGVWLHSGEANFIVDVGPAATAPGLFEVLDDLGIKRLDYILLTHVHIDHAGAAAEVAEHFPDAPIICHSAGIPHLVDPTRLWEGTVKTLGETGMAYGRIRGVEKSRFVEAEQFESGVVEAILTPGHAPHHVSYIAGSCLFAGEAGGVSLEVEPGVQYLRPATPPRFFLETSVKSIDALVSRSPRKICYGHFGMRDDAVGMLSRHRDQLHAWNDIVREELESSPRKDFISDCLNALLRQDKNLEGFFALPPEVQERERGFLCNSIRGFAGYLQSLADNP